MKKTAFILLLGFPLFALAQHYRFIPFNVNNGLSQNSVHCIYQDRDGLLWIGTQDGLNSFDGRNFKTYRYDPADTNSLSDHFILSIAEDTRGFLWIGTGHGLNRLDKRTGRIKRYYLYAGEENKVSAAYSNLLITSSGELLIPHTGVSALIDKTGTLRSLDSSLSNLQGCQVTGSNQITGYHINKGIVALSMKQGFSIDYMAATAFNAPAWPYYIKTINGPGNKLWLYTNEPKSRIYFFDKTTKKILKDTFQLSTTINHITITRDGSAWISTMNGIYILKEGVIRDYFSNAPGSVNAGLPGSILCSYEDRQGNIWIGSASAGFAYYHPSFDNFRLTSTGIENNAVTAAVETKDAVWLGSATGLFIQQKGSSKKLFAGQRIVSLTKDKEQRIWAGVQNDGLYILGASGNILKAYKRRDSVLNTTNILYLFTDSRNRVFLCTETGFFVFTDINNWISFYQRSAKAPSSGWYTLHGFEDAQHQVWLSKHLGVEVLDENLNRKFEILSNNNTAPVNRTIITGCTQDKQGNIWIGTLRSGIYLYKEGKLKQYTTADGLVSNLIYGINCDNRGRIWATTTAGMNIFVPAENRFYPLTSADGLPSDEYVLGALIKNEKGELLTGSSKGLITIDAGRIEPAGKKAEAAVMDVQADGKSIDRSAKIFILEPGFKTLSFRFALNQSVQPRKIFFQYRLLGVDTVWSFFPDDNPQLTYTSLPYKNLSMQVRAAYALYDLPSAPVSTFSFTVKAPFWKTITFRWLVVLVSLGVIALLVQQYNKARFRKQMRILQTQKELQQERQRISRDLHDNIGAYTSALIAGINQLKTTEANREEQFTELNDYASSIMGYLRETIWVLNKEELTLTGFADRFKNYAARILRNYPELSAAYKVDIGTEKKLSPQLSLNLFRILQEALQNACKHAGATRITVTIINNPTLCCKIADNGTGWSGSLRDDSYGISNMQQRAAETGLDLLIESESQKGTTIVIREKK